MAFASRALSAFTDRQGAYALGLAAALFFIAGCSPTPDSGSPQADQKKVLTTFIILADIILADIAQNVAGDALTVDSITRIDA